MAHDTSETVFDKSPDDGDTEERRRREALEERARRDAISNAIEVVLQVFLEHFDRFSIDASRSLIRLTRSYASSWKY